MVKIGVDLSSAEKDSLDLFESIEIFLKEDEEVHLIVFIESKIQEEFQKKFPYIPVRCEIVYTNNDVRMGDIPNMSLAERKDSAMVLGLEYLKKGKIQSFFSPGNSGALLVLSKSIIGLRKRVSFPAVGVILPRAHDYALLLDAGASFEFDEERILELVYLGKEYYQKNFATNPKIGLLNIGKERYKGSLTLKRVDRFLTKVIPEQYNGFMEGFDIFKANAETNIFVTDAYTGNILLKSWEGFLSYIFTFIHKNYTYIDEKIDENIIEEIEKILSFLKGNFHYSQIGAAPLLGLKKMVFLGHGRTSNVAILGALEMMKSHVLKQEELPIYMKRRSKWAKQFDNKG